MSLFADRRSTPVWGLGALAFLVLSSYAVARPAVESLYLEAYTSRGLPAVWIAVAIAVVICVGIYNRFAARTGLVRMFGVTAALSAALLVLLQLARQAEVPGATFALYIWKDVYVVVLVEIFWTFSNTVVPTGTARWLYGFFCALGALGALTGNLLVGYVAGRVGTAGALWMVVPILAAATTLCIWVDKEAGRHGMAALPERVSVSLGDGVRLVRSSSYLALMVGLIAVVQLVITLVDYQYNTVLEATFTDTDERTAVIGTIYASINGLSFVLQVGTGPILALVGIPRTLLGIPIAVGMSLLAFALVPGFAVVAIAKVASKAFDYSLFRAAKEILYIPLPYAEQTRGKAVVDMLTYRVAKGGASLLILGLTALAATGWVLWIALVLVGVWVVVTARILPRYEARRHAHEGA